MLSENKKEILKNVFKKYHKVMAVYLFGSHAEDKTGPFSDLDLGIVLDEDCPVDIKLYILTDLANHDFCNVDLVILNASSLLTRFEVVKHNQVIYKRYDFDSSAYYTRVIKEYQDFRYLLKIQRSYFKERLLNG